MVNGKRVIGIIVGKADSESSFNYVHELYHFAQECDYITVVYNLLADFNETGAKSDYDYNMLHVLNFEYVDAIVVIKDSFMPVSLVDAVVKYAKEQGKPRAVIGMYHSDAFSIEYQGYDSYEQIVRHIVEEHGCKQVYFIGDMDKEETSSMCLEIYRKVLEDNDIPFLTDKVALVKSGDNMLANTISEWVDGSDRPDAIVCSTDYLAMLACRALSNKGYLVPENVIVAGSGLDEENRVYFPKLTTTHKDVNVVCEIVMDLFDESFANNSFDNMVIKQQLQVEFSESCGCKHASVEEFSRVTSNFTDRINNMEMFLSKMFELTGKMSDISSVSEMAETFSRHIDKNSNIVLRNSVWESELPASATPSYEDSVTVITSGNNPLTDQRRVFPLGIYTAEMDTIDQEDCIRYVHLLHFNNIVYGYYVSKNCSDVKSISRQMRFVDIANINLNSVFNAQKLRIASEKLLELQIRDSLTGFYNFKGFQKRINEGYISNRDGRKLIIFSFDVDGFSDINEKFGHLEGDNALVSLAEIIRASATVDDCIARSGADEYLLAIATAEDCEYIIYNYMNSFYQSLKNFNSIHEKKYELNVFVSHYVGTPASLEELNELVKAAIGKKNTEKKKDKNIAADAKNTVASKEYEMFRKLIDTNSFDYMFQPIVNAYTGEIFGYEALMRSVGDIALSPIRILEIATQYDRLKDVERATVKNVYAKVAKNKQIVGSRKVFINSIIGHTLDESEAVEAIGENKDISPCMVVELTEQTNTTEAEFTEYVTTLKQAGIQIAIDDFGTGYSNTSRLLEASPNYVKIDRSLIAGIQSDYRKQHFVNNIIQYAHENGFMALAEGVETALELKCVIKLGVDLIQGYFTARPSFEIIDHIDVEISRMIITSSAKHLYADEVEKAYVVDDQEIVDIKEFRAGDFRQIYASMNDFTLVGDDEITPCNITLPDGYEGTVTIKDLNVRSNHGNPIIELGDNSSVTIRCEGDNYLHGGGIFVPESSSVFIVGEGRLFINAEMPKAIGIGGLPDGAYGNININLTGGIEMSFAADTAIGIGGSYNMRGRSIVIKNTPITMNPAVANFLGIGCIFDQAKIHITDSIIDIHTGVRLFLGIGSVRSNPIVQIVRSKLNFEVGGNSLVTIGSFGDAQSSISIVDSDISYGVQGKSVVGIGAESGACAINISATSFKGSIEGASVMVFGIRTKEGSLSFTDNTVDLFLSSEDLVEYSVEEKNLVFLN